MQNRALELLKTWCDTLLTYRVSSHSPKLDGAILCPCCHSIHGRIADLTFPLTLLYAKTGDEKYINAADQLIDWTQRNLKRPDGSWRNDAGNQWKGISAFSAMSVGEAIYNFSDVIPTDIKEKWMKVFLQLTEFLYDFFPKIKPVINYYTGTACEMALAWKLTGNQKYLAMAQRIQSVCFRNFDENGLLYGEVSECGDIGFVTEGGCHYIDMGYNMEESLPMLVRYSLLTGENKEFYRDRYRDQLEFLLADGGIDDSWGSRHNKWTWWGSRTCDGALEGLALLADEPIFATACEKVLGIYEKMTVDGLLSLPMAKEADEPTCLHHSFCHAKALAVLALAENVTAQRAELPCEKNYGIKFFQNSKLALVSHNGWRATVSAVDTLYTKGCENGGGNMTLLMHGLTPVCAATMRRYSQVEPANMQMLRNSDSVPCMTPRLDFGDYDNLTESGITLEKTAPCEVCAKGKDWNIKYSFGEKVIIDVSSERKANFMLPVVKSGEIKLLEDAVEVGNIRVEAKGIKCNSVPMFNQVGGFLWYTLAVEVDKLAVITISAI
ncbi:MAG: hypothetical protein E7588_05735 [Ruminococcaceae bacterium]|nr:hypothetical protein [Oscillospiraceae bacterium]